MSLLAAALHGMHGPTPPLSAVFLHTFSDALWLASPVMCQLPRCLGVNIGYMSYLGISFRQQQVQYNDDDASFEKHATRLQRRSRLY